METVKVIAVLPHLLSDRVFDLYASTIKDIPLTHELKRCRNSFVENYSLYNRLCFSKYQDADAAIDLMDELEQLISNDVNLLRIRIMSLMSELDVVLQKRLSTMYLCSVLSSMANIIVSTISGKDSRLLTKLSRLMHKMSNMYMTYLNYDKHIDPNQDESIIIFVNKIIDKSIKWSYTKTIDLRT